jgi:hypothetical protein
VVPRAQLLRQIEDLDLPTPLDNIAQRKLGQALGVEYVATGRLVRVQTEDAGRRARVTLAVVLTDAASGEPANGAIVTGVANAAPDTAAGRRGG